jgi:menaquinone-dependent protoporphyrinogen oxidase
MHTTPEHPDQSVFRPEGEASPSPSNSPHVLVLYASKYGATRGIAERITEALIRAGLRADLRKASDDPNPAAYDAMILGSAVYIGRWRRDAVRFLTRNQQQLQHKVVWFFSSGPTGEGRAKDLINGWDFPEKLRPLCDAIKPEGITVFHGAIDPQRLNWLERRMIRAVGADTGDFRRWEEVDAWAAGIAARLMPSGDQRRQPERPAELERVSVA